MPDTPNLLPSNSTRLERALATLILRRLDAIPVPIRDLWDADRCPALLLGWLAWANSVDVWQEEWSEAQKREVIRQSFKVHVHKGTVGAVRRALAALDIGAEIIEWWQDDAPRGTFKIDAFADRIFDAGGAIDARLLAMVTAVVDRAKRASQHFTLRVVERFTARQPMRPGVRMKARQSGELRPRPVSDVETSLSHFRAGFRHRRVDRAVHHFEASTV